MKIIRTGKTEWVPRHETFKQKIVDLYDLANQNTGNVLNDYNDTTKGIQGIIKEAIDKNLRVRAIGGEWSWTKIGAMDGILLNTKPLNLTFKVSAPSTHPSYANTPEDLHFTQCGVSIQELSLALKKRGRSIKTSGASNGQTVAGSMSTGTHGAAIDLGCITEFVVALHIIVSPTRHIWLERASYPVASDVLVNRLGAERVSDDALFNAALVSFGSFGFIHGIMVESEPLFLYEAYRERLPFDAKVHKMMQTLDFTNSPLPHGSERPFHFQMVLNPYDLDGGAFVTTMYKRPYTTNYISPLSALGGVVPGDDAPAFIGGLVGAIPSLIPVAVNALVAASYKPYSNVWGTHAEIFTNTDTHGRVLSSGIGIDPKDSVQVTKILFELNEAEPFSGIFSYRWVGGSGATLGFTKFKPTCVVELDGELSDRSIEFCKQFWAMLDAAGIPYTFHWGKVLELNQHSIRKMYGQSTINEWLAARKTLMQDPASMRAFTNDLMVDWGLDGVAAGESTA